VIVRLSADGERLGLHRIVNDPFELMAVMTHCCAAPEVVMEATYGWYWAVQLLQDLGATVHLANPNALNWGDRRVKNDVIDATDLADMLRLGRLPEAWIAPPALRELRELVRLSRQARAAPHRAQGAGARGDGERRRARETHRHVLRGGEPSTRSARARRAVRTSGPLIAGTDRPGSSTRWTTTSARCPSSG
jgi:hypothetical protein